MGIEEKIGKLGFGLMRLPKVKEGDVEKIDIEQTKVMVDMFFKAGFNYFDTAWAYPGSEDAARQALVERYPRESYYLATKNTAWVNCKSQADAIEQFNTSLRQTGAKYFDFYLLHCLGDARTPVFDDYDMWNWGLEQKAKGLIRHLGFSFHATPEELEEIIVKHPQAEFVQLQINYGDWEDPAVESRRLYEVARKYNKPIIVMEPVKGGMLATPPKTVEAVLKKADPNASCASWAVKFAANLPGVLTVLSGMSNIEQMKDNLSYMTDFTGLSEAELATLDEARAEFAKVPLIQCTSCNYCAKVCPKNIGVSGSFAALNYYTLYDQLEGAKFWEGWYVTSQGKAKATECIKCGKCEQACPQHLPIRDLLVRVADTLLKD